ncbi:MAG: arsenate reductase family protein [Flavobacteriales bacterium]
MNVFYYLSSCNTCKRILNELQLPKSILLHDIKKQPLTTINLQQLVALSASYQALFNKRARLYKEQNLKEKNLTEEDIKTLLLQHYTFLKRPVLVLNNQIFIGNSKKTIQMAKNALKTLK